MNKLIIITLILTTLSCRAQTNVIDIVNRCNHTPINRGNGNLYLKDISDVYAPFIGTWKWSQGNKEMALTLIKQNKYHIHTYGNNNYYEDRLVGYYLYKENGLTIIDTSSENLMQDFGLSVDFNTDCYGNIGTPFFQDIAKNKSYEVNLKLLSPTQLKFKGKEGENTYFRPKTGTIVYSTDSTFPLEMIFIKQ